MNEFLGEVSHFRFWPWALSEGEIRAYVEDGVEPTPPSWVKRDP